MATKSVGPNLYGGAAEFTRARRFLLVGVVSVLGLIMGVSWTVVRNDPASSDSEASQGMPFVVAPAAVNGLRPAGMRTLRPRHAVLPTVARSSAPAGATIEPFAPAAGASLVQPSAPATPSAPVTAPTTVAPPAPAVASTPAPPTSVAPPPPIPQPAAVSVATPPTSPPVPAAVETPAPPAPTTPAVVAPASVPAAPTNGGRGDDGPAKDDSRRGEDRDEKSRSDNDRDNDRAKQAKEQLEQAREAVNELLAKAQARLNDVVKGKSGRG